MRSDALVVGQHRDRLARDGRRRERVLNQLRHDPLAGNQIDHADVVDGDETPQQPIGQRRHAVDDDHRRVVQRRLHGRRARRRQHDVRRGEDRVGVALDAP